MGGVDGGVMPLADLRLQLHRNGHGQWREWEAKNEPVRAANVGNRGTAGQTAIVISPAAAPAAPPATAATAAGKHRFVVWVGS